MGGVISIGQCIMPGSTFGMAVDVRITLGIKEFSHRDCVKVPMALRPYSSAEIGPETLGLPSKASKGGARVSGQSWGVDDGDSPSTIRDQRLCVISGGAILAGKVNTIPLSGGRGGVSRRDV